MEQAVFKYLQVTGAVMHSSKGFPVKMFDANERPIC